MEKSNFKRNNGITLVALVITIIILLILAGISIASLTQTGLFAAAEDAKSKTEEKTEEENATLQNYASEIARITGQSTSGSGTGEGSGTGSGSGSGSESGSGAGTGTPVSELQIGDYVDYEVTYTDAHTGYEFTSANGWRVLNPNATDKDENAFVDIISTGVPAKLYYYYDSVKNADWAKAAVADRSAYKAKFYGSSSNDNNNMYAAAGMYYNFGSIPFTVTTSPTANNGGYTKINGKIEAITGSEFVKGNASGVHNLTISELNAARNITTQEDLTSTATTDAATGLFYLKGLGKYRYDSNTSAANYWLASPTSGDTGDLRFVCSDGSINYGISGTSGVRPVVSIPTSNFNLHKVTPQ